MSSFRISLALAVALAASPAFAAKLSEADRAALQAAMVQHIDARAADGLYRHVDIAAGRLIDYAPAKSHPMMFQMGEVFVLCTDFKAPDGASTNVDFYMLRQGKGYAVVDTQIANRAPLMKLMDSGKVQPLE